MSKNKNVIELAARCPEQTLVNLNRLTGLRFRRLPRSLVDFDGRLSEQKDSYNSDKQVTAQARR